ncbi:MaoC/PaaZ C-terminal domain-containing protein [Labrys wisconsinensis]|uniref:Acyl dehydratase n=1 Tax=Labrys wisconsinensis TaxID=425677 RepID=A0ABU0JFF9_9HYPH|nr:MaoC/PaaZ C-terminal domain-containing protein [Labrys wisconsinensis]MDQ0471857.1 acyl dehydratase [Labrys wisconsinensis]
MERPRYFEDYVLGEERRSHGRTITETDFVVHAGHTGDFFPHHMDAEHMKASPFGQRIAHGTMTFAIGIGLTASEINPLAFTYGYDRLRFPRPVFIGDTIHTVLTVSALEPDPRRPDKGRVVESCRVVNQRGETVLACDHVLLAERRPAA